MQRTARTPARRQNGPRSGTHLGTNAATARSAKAEIAESEYCSRIPIATFRFVRSEKYVRKGLLRLCVAVGITWIGWVGYKSLPALTDGSGWDDLSSIVWLILMVPLGGPILIAWVVAGFQKSAAGSE